MTAFWKFEAVLWPVLLLTAFSGGGRNPETTSSDADAADILSTASEDNTITPGHVISGDSCDSLDISINGAIFFNNALSMRNAFPNLRSAWMLNDRVYFITKDSSRFISLGSNYGGSEDEYKEAAVGYVKGNGGSFVPDEIRNSSFNPDQDPPSPYPAFYFTACRFTDFVSGRGIRLGMREQEFLGLLSGKRLERKDNSDSRVYKYVQEYCLYEASYTFEGDSLVYFSFGFITP